MPPKNPYGTAANKPRHNTMPTRPNKPHPTRTNNNKNPTHHSPLTTPHRNVNMYKYKQQGKKPLTSQELHAKANKARRQETKDAKYRYALSQYDAQVHQGLKNPEVPTIEPSPARKRRAAIRATMREALESGDLTHIPLLVDFLKKIHSPTHTNRYDHENLHQDPAHVAMIKDEVAALQSYGLFAKTPQPTKLNPGPNTHLNRHAEIAMDQRIFGQDQQGLEIYQQGKYSMDDNAPGQYSMDEMELKLQALQDDADSITNLVSKRQTKPIHGNPGLDNDDAYGAREADLEEGNVAVPIQRDPHAQLKAKGNDLSRLLLEPVYGLMGDNAGSGTTTIDHLAEQSINFAKAQKATPIGGFSAVNDPKQFASLQPMTHSITGDVISSISLHNDEFGSLAGSPTFRINPQNLKKNQLASAGGNGGKASQFGEEIDDDDDIEMEREADAQLAMDNQGTLGLHDSPLQKHANEFTTASLIPTLGFLREYRSQHGEKQKREMGQVEDIDALGSTVAGIGSLSRTDGHYTNPRQQAVISGRRSRAIETIARTSAAVLAKRQLLAHNRNIVSAINPALAQGSREHRDKHYVDLYALGYQITGIHLTKDLSTCVINWSAPCLFPLPESKNTMELERPLLDVVNEAMHGDAARAGRVELNPQNDAMRVLADSQTHIHRRANYATGANLTQRHVFTGDGHNLFQEKMFAKMKEEEEKTGKKTEVFFDQKTGVTIKKEPSGEMKITSQGDPALWKLRPIFQRGSYIPGTVDMLPPYLRKNSQVMTPQHHQQKQQEARQRIRMEELNIRAGMQGNMDPRFSGEAEAMLKEDEALGLENGFGMDELGLGPNVNPTIAKQTLDAMVNSTNNQSPISKVAHRRALRLVAAATEYYLNSMVPSIRWALGQSLNTKYVPQLKFEFDLQYGATKQRAKTINAVLQRQFKKQIERVEFGQDADDDYKQLDQDQKPIPIHTIGTPAERSDKLELVLEKQKLLKRGKMEEVDIIDQFVKNESTEAAKTTVRAFENAGFQDYDDVAPHDEAMMKRLQVKDDNVAKLLATADALKSGVENELALSTRLKYHDITKADRIKLVSLYLDIPESQARGLSEDRIDVVISMLRRDMATDQRRKQRQAFKDEKIAQGLSKVQLEREMAKYDTKLRKQKKKGKKSSQQGNDDMTDDDDGVSRWQAGVDSDDERPDVGHLMDGADDGEVADVTSSRNKDGLTWGTQDSGIAAAFMTNMGKDNALVKGGKRKAKLDVNEGDLTKFRQQYLYGNDDPNDHNETTTTTTTTSPKKNSKFLEFDDDDSSDIDNDTLPQSKSRQALAQKQQPNQSQKSKQYLEFDDTSSEEEFTPTPAQQRQGEAKLREMLSGTGEAKM